MPRSRRARALTSPGTSSSRAILFAIGALGVLLRRSPLIVLLSLEIMLNAANLALIAFSRQHGDGDGQIFALAVMAVAASEVVVGLGLIVAMRAPAARARRRHADGRSAADRDRRRLDLPARPLAGALAITLGGDAISRRTAGWISTLLGLHGRSPAPSSRSSSCSATTPEERDAARRPRGRGSRPAASTSG